MLLLMFCFVSIVPHTICNVDVTLFFRRCEVGWLNPKCDKSKHVYIFIYFCLDGISDIILVFGFFYSSIINIHIITLRCMDSLKKNTSVEKVLKFQILHHTIMVKHIQQPQRELRILSFYASAVLLRLLLMVQLLFLTGQHLSALLTCCRLVKRIHQNGDGVLWVM